MDNIHLGTCKMWSLQAGGLYIQVVFKAGLTVLLKILFLNLRTVLCDQISQTVIQEAKIKAQEDHTQVGIEQKV